MPTVLQWRGHRFLFYSKEIGEPPHIHVLKDAKQMKVWLRDLRLARNAGFAGHEINAIMKIVAENQDRFLEAWDDYFGN
ncbi:DUF4160 domain-containing protein [Jiella sp. 40Bstr34]|uniref:DUF4160 domain-containing protein n=1 Tax=Jiella pacifica TaxID=2696469 RepID=A0A6N9T2M1_9HYPH|nr:DUF4160 domain-containing protein [Jiella pacifica]